MSLTLKIFYAEWCAPSWCMLDMVDEVAKELDSYVTVERVDIDAHPEVAKAHDIRLIPSVLIVEGGDGEGLVLQQFVGVIPKARLLQALEL